MKLLEIIEAIKSGDLVLEKHECGKKVIYRRVLSKTKGDFVSCCRKSRKTGLDESYDRWIGEFVKMERKEYPKVMYMANEKGTNRGYRISKKVYDTYK
jgi:hypothetical protein